MRFAREAWPFVLPFVPLAAILWWLGGSLWGALGLVAGFAVLLFFRDPARDCDAPDDVVVAPASGRVLRVDLVEAEALGEGRWRRVVTFLSVFDVHVQHVPVSGTVVSTKRTAGRKVAAFRRDADRLNESVLTVLRLESGETVGIRQIAGLVARRVVCYVERDQAVERGEHLGIIKFGSRVDLLVPERYAILVNEGDRVVNGRTPVAQPDKRRSTAEP